jgi:hypothetical protein
MAADSEAVTAAIMVATRFTVAEAEVGTAVAEAITVEAVRAAVEADRMEAGTGSKTRSLIRK